MKNLLVFACLLVSSLYYVSKKQKFGGVDIEFTRKSIQQELKSPVESELTSDLPS